MGHMGWGIGFELGWGGVGDGAGVCGAWCGMGNMG